MGIMRYMIYEFEAIEYFFFTTDTNLSDITIQYLRINSQIENLMNI